MGQSILSIGDVIRTESSRGRLIDVDHYCRFFEPLFPRLTIEQIREEIRRAVCSGGGGAVWGLDGAMPPNEEPLESNTGDEPTLT